MKHYSYTTFWRAGYSWRGHISSSDHGIYLPAAIFYDMEGNLQFDDALEAARTLVADMPRPLRAMMRKVGWFDTSIPREGDEEDRDTYRARIKKVAWLFAPYQRAQLLTAGIQPANVRYISDLFAEDLKYTLINETRLYERCTHPYMFMGQCGSSCPESRTYTNEQAGYYDGVPRCTAEQVYGQVPDVPEDTLVRTYRPTSAPDWQDMRKPLGEFTFVSGVYLARRTAFAPSSVTLDAFDPTNIEDHREKRQEMAQAAARTRRLEREVCPGCIFSREGKRACWTRAPSYCTGKKSELDMQYNVDQALQERDPRKLFPGFTPLQMRHLMELGNHEVEIPGGVFTQTRKTLGRLGRFRHRYYASQGNGFMVLPRSCRVDDAAVYQTWDALVTAIPAILDFAMPEEPFADEVYWLYGQMMRREYSATRSGWGQRRPLAALHASERAIDAYYGNNPRYLRYSTASNPVGISKKELFTGYVGDAPRADFAPVGYEPLPYEER